MIRKQLLVALGMALAAVIVWCAWTIAPRPAVDIAPGDDAARLAFAAKWLLVPGLSLLVGIAMTAGRRFFSADAMDGTHVPSSKALEINLRYNQNTLEQTLLAVIAWPAMALLLPPGQLGLIAVLAVLFGFGRLAFFVGYLLAPWARAFGFALTFYPTVAAYGYAVIHAL